MRARPFVLLVAGALAASACGRGSNETRTGASPGAASADTGAAAAGYGSPGTPGTFTAEVVEVDTSKNTVTLRNASASGAGSKSGERTVRVGATATSTLASVKKGDQVVVSCDQGGGMGTGPASAPGATGTGRGGPAATTPSAGYGPAGGNDGMGATIGPPDLTGCATVVSMTRVGGR